MRPIASITRAFSAFIHLHHQREITLLGSEPSEQNDAPAAGSHCAAAWSFGEPSRALLLNALRALLAAGRYRPRPEKIAEVMIRQGIRHQQAAAGCGLEIDHPDK